MKQRFVIARMQHETNTFSSLPTTLQSFMPSDLTRRGGNSALAAFIDIAEAENAEAVIPIAVTALPGGVVEAAAFDHIAERILAAVSAGCDALFLDLHGAMVAAHTDDGEGELLRRIRRIAPDLPIAVALDFHTNLSEDIVRHATVIAGYKTYPHVDMYETGRLAGQILVRALKGEVKPVMAWGWKPMLTHMLRQAPDDGPTGEIVALARQAEADGSVLAATLLGGFPLADTRFTGLGAVVVADANHGAAQALCDRMLEIAWTRRDEYVYREEPLSQSIARAKIAADAGTKPVLLIDHSDNAGAGGGQDDMTVVREILAQQLDDVVVAGIFDPVAVQAMAEAGVGATLALPIGGRTDVPSMGLVGQPLQLTGVVRHLGDGEYVTDGPMSTGETRELGPSAVLDTGRVQIIVNSRRGEPVDLGVFTHAGIDPLRRKVLMIKSRIHYRAAYRPLVGEIIECAGNGACTSNYDLLHFSKLSSPMYPID